MKPTGPDLLMALGVALVVAAVAALAGGWWATGLAGLTMVWVGYVGNREQQRRQSRPSVAAANTKDGR